MQYQKEQSSTSLGKDIIHQKTGPTDVLLGLQSCLWKNRKIQKNACTNVHWLNH